MGQRAHTNKHTRTHRKESARAMNNYFRRSPVQPSIVCVCVCCSATEGDIFHMLSPESIKIKTTRHTHTHTLATPQKENCVCVSEPSQNHRHHTGSRAFIRGNFSRCHTGSRRRTEECRRRRRKRRRTLFLRSSGGCEIVCVTFLFVRLGCVCVCCLPRESACIKNRSRCDVRTNGI